MDGCLELAEHIPAPDSPAAGEDERRLIHRAQRGDRAAFDELVRLYDRQVLRLVMKIVRSPEEARDLYQEAFLKVYRSLGRFRFESRFSTWLYRVVTNVCYDHLRRQRSREEVQAPASDEGQPEYFHSVPDGQPAGDPERALHSGEIRGRIRKALERLGPRERMVFELRHFQGLKLRAIGELCGTSEETAKNSLFRATQKLRLELSDLV
jgi:RNA polymerase sigma-70 factor, ECF subfamily